MDRIFNTNIFNTTFFEHDEKPQKIKFNITNYVTNFSIKKILW